MYGLEYEIIESNIKILNVELYKVRIKGERLLLSRPMKLFKSKYKLWEEELNSLFKEEYEIQDKLLLEYQKIEKLLSKK